MGKMGEVAKAGTPGAPNLPTALPLFINEWMASNTNTLADPADGDFEDWFELYNAGAAPINLAGFTLSDDAANPTKFRIPAGTMLPPHGFLLVWADEETGQNRPGQADLQKLEKRVLSYSPVTQCYRRVNLEIILASFWLCFL